jgi:hypothetical protein
VQHNEVKEDVKTVTNDLNILHGRIQQELQKIDQRLRAAETTVNTAVNSATAAKRAAAAGGGSSARAVPRSCGSQFTASSAAVY